MPGTIDRLPMSAETVFAWHERPQALGQLLPRSRWVRIENRTGGIRDGDRVTIAVGMGHFVLRWRPATSGMSPAYCTAAPASGVKEHLNG